MDILQFETVDLISSGLFYYQFRFMKTIKLIAQKESAYNKNNNYKT